MLYINIVLYWFYCVKGHRVFATAEALEVYRLRYIYPPGIYARLVYFEISLFVYAINHPIMSFAGNF